MAGVGGGVSTLSLAWLRPLLKEAHLSLEPRAHTACPVTGSSRVQSTHGPECGLLSQPPNVPTCQFSVPHLLAEKAPTATQSSALLQILLHTPWPSPEQCPRHTSPAIPAIWVETALATQFFTPWLPPDALSARPAPPSLSTAYAETTLLSIKPCSPPSLTPTQPTPDLC